MNASKFPTFLRSFLISFTFLLYSTSQATLASSHGLPRSLVVEHERVAFYELDEEVKLFCDSWRLAVEANSINPWKTVPQECGAYVKDYMNGRGYSADLERVSREAVAYSKKVELGCDGRDAWIFDIDETLLSNLPYYAEHGFGLEVFDSERFDKWVEEAAAPAAIQSSMKLYKEVMDLGFKVLLLTGRKEKQRAATVKNLINAGFRNWDELILRSPDVEGKQATVYKSEKLEEMAKEGYRILGNSGDQWSDLLGSSMLSCRSFKLPNPMYHIL